MYLNILYTRNITAVHRSLVLSIQIIGCLRKFKKTGYGLEVLCVYRFFMFLQAKTTRSSGKDIDE